MAYLEGAVSDVAGLKDLKGGYNASTNSPDLDTSPSGILQGDTYNVTAAGTFFTQAVQVGDELTALQDTPTTLAHWLVLNSNNPITGSADGSQAIIPDGGSDGLPSLAWGDGNTGWWQDGDNVFKMSLAGGNAMTLTWASLGFIRPVSCSEDVTVAKTDGYIYADRHAGYTLGSANRLVMKSANKVEVYAGNTFVGEYALTGGKGKILAGFNTVAGILAIANSSFEGNAISADILSTNITVDRDYEMADSGGTLSVWEQNSVMGTEALTVDNATVSSGALTANTTYEVTTAGSATDMTSAVGNINSVNGRDEAAILLQASLETAMETLGTIIKTTSAFTPTDYGSAVLTPVLPIFGDTIEITSDNATATNRTRTFPVNSGVNGQEMTVLISSSGSFDAEIEGETLADDGNNMATFKRIGGAWYTKVAPHAG
jgi:hypothetical protein